MVYPTPGKMFTFFDKLSTDNISTGNKSHSVLCLSFLSLGKCVCMGLVQPSSGDLGDEAQRDIKMWDIFQRS